MGEETEKAAEGARGQDSSEKQRSSRARRARRQGGHILVDSSVLNDRNRAKFNFNAFLQTDVPPTMRVSMVQKAPRRYRLHTNEELQDLDLAQLRKKVKTEFQVDLVDHGTMVGKSERNGSQSNTRMSPRKRRHKEDPLADSKYLRIYERMAKDEKRFFDREKGAIKREVEDYAELLPLLGIELRAKEMYWDLLRLDVGQIPVDDVFMANIRTILPQITQVDNPNNDDEVLMKFRLTVREMQTAILKHMRLKRLDEMLRKENLAYALGEGVRDQEAATAKNVVALQRKRLEARSKRMGPIRKINFKEGVSLTMDPIAGPSVTKL